MAKLWVEITYKFFPLYATQKKKKGYVRNIINFIM